MVKLNPSKILIFTTMNSTRNPSLNFIFQLNSHHFDNLHMISIPFYRRFESAEEWNKRPHFPWSIVSQNTNSCHAPELKRNDSKKRERREEKCKDHFDLCGHYLTAENQQQKKTSNILLEFLMTWSASSRHSSCAHVKLCVVHVMLDAERKHSHTHTQTKDKW